MERGREGMETREKGERGPREPRDQKNMWLKCRGYIGTRTWGEGREACGLEGFMIEWGEKSCTVTTELSEPGDLCALCMVMGLSAHRNLGFCST